MQFLTERAAWKKLLQFSHCTALVKDMATRLFEEAEHVSTYAQYRPHYSIKVRNVIKDFMEKQGCGFGSVVDVGTESGQALSYWSEVFRNCVGVDINAEQIKRATKAFQDKGATNVKLHVSPAEDLPLSAGSCDLVTCATTWHWLDAEKFYKKATRVLRQPGVLAVYSYGIPFFPHNQKATDVTMKFHTETLSKAWPPGMRHIVNKYKEVELPYSVTERHDITQEWPIPLSQFVAFLRTLVSYRKYMKEYPGEDPVDVLHQDLKDSFSTGVNDPIVNCTFPVFIIQGAKDASS